MKKIAILILAIVASVTVWLNRADLAALLRNSRQLAVLVQDGTFLDTLKREVLAPPPLRFGGDSSRALLTRAGVIAATNQQRAANTEAGLRENQLLDRAAALKISDMFAKQYFEHISPSGKGPADLAREAGYDYIVIGENLALGNFENDTALVAAWMGSPGHRENILNTKFSEIGAAVGQGTFEGEKVWLAVQEFGRPATACPSVSTALKSQTDSLKAQLDQQARQLDADKARIDAWHPKAKEDYDAYNQAVADYNQSVKTYNTRLNELRALVNQYNLQVREFNACVGS